MSAMPSPRVGERGGPFSLRIEAGQFYLTNFHSYTIAILTFLILFFFLDPSILLNVTQLISLTIFNL